MINNKFNSAECEIGELKHRSTEDIQINRERKIDGKKHYGRQLKSSRTR